MQYGQYPAPRFTIAHLSDVHLLAHGVKQYGAVEPEDGLRTAIGIQQSSPSSVIVSLALFLTFFVMGPTFTDVYQNAMQPLAAQQITTDEALTRLEKARIPAGPLLSPLQTLDDAQVKATGLLTWVDYPGLPRPAPLVPGPVQFGAFDTGIRLRPPTLGEHTDQILDGQIFDGEILTDPLSGL